MSFPRKPKECHNLEKKYSDKTETALTLNFKLIKRNLRPYIDHSVVFPDAEAKLYEPRYDPAHGPYDRFKMIMAG